MPCRWGICRSQVNLAVQLFRSVAAPALKCQFVRPVTRLDRSNRQSTRKSRVGFVPSSARENQPDFSRRPGRRDCRAGRRRDGDGGRPAARTVLQFRARRTAVGAVDAQSGPGAVACRYSAACFSASSPRSSGATGRSGKSIRSRPMRCMAGACRSSAVSSSRRRRCGRAGSAPRSGLRPAIRNWRAALPRGSAMRFACAAATCACWSAAAPRPASPARSARRSPALFTLSN